MRQKIIENRPPHVEIFLHPDFINLTLQIILIYLYFWIFYFMYLGKSIKSRQVTILNWLSFDVF